MYFYVFVILYTKKYYFRYISSHVSGRIKVNKKDISRLILRWSPPRIC